MTRVVHRGKEPCTVIIDRTSIFGNPFRIGRDGTREEVIAKYREWIRTQPQIMCRIKMLKHETLGCWCKPLACHGDVLAELADESQ